jgi:hypothetical protein
LAHVGYARVSTLDQDPALQLDALETAGCTKVFEDRASGARAERVGLRSALEYVRNGDVLIVWKLDRLGRSLPHLIETVTELERRGVGFRSITEAIDTTTPGGRLVFYVHLALMYPSYASRISAASVDPSGQVSFSWGGTGFAGSGNSERSLIYDSTGRLANEVGVRPSPAEPSVSISTNHLIGNFYVNEMSW